MNKNVKVKKNVTGEIVRLSVKELLECSVIYPSTIVF